MDRLHRVVVQVGTEIWPSWSKSDAASATSTKPPGAAAAGGSLSVREMRDFEETMQPAYELLQPGTSIFHELERADRLISAELWLLNRMLYKNKNQHAHAHYWRHLVHLKKVMAKLVDLKLPLLRQRLPPAFSPPAAAKAPADTPKGGASKKAPVKPAQRAPTKVELESVLYWLLAIAVYCNEVSHIIEKCSLDMMALIEHTFFMPFAITALGIASRFYSLCKLVIVQLDYLYGALHRALEFYPKSKRAQDVGADQAIRQSVVDQFAGLLGSLPVLLQLHLKESETVQSVALAQVMKQAAGTFMDATRAPSVTTTTTTATATTPSLAAPSTPVTPAASATPSSSSRKRKAVVGAIGSPPLAATAELSHAPASDIVSVAASPSSAPKTKPIKVKAKAAPSPQATPESAFKYREVGAKKRKTNETATTNATSTSTASASPRPSAVSPPAAVPRPMPPAAAPESAARDKPTTTTATLKGKAPAATATKPTAAKLPAATGTTTKSTAAKSPAATETATKPTAAKAKKPAASKPSESLDDIMAALLPGKKKRPAPTTPDSKPKAAATTVKADGTPPAKRVKAKAGKVTSEGAGSLDDIFASLLPSSSSPSAGSGKGKKTPTKKKSTLH